MQDHEYSFEVDASPEEVWSIFWGKKTGDIMEHGNLRIEILHGGDEQGEGLIRHCHFPVPTLTPRGWFHFPEIHSAGIR